jgi:transposase
VHGAAVLHADETPVNILVPGSGKTKRAYVWAYARSAFDALAGVEYDFCIGRAAKYRIAFFKDWSGTLVCDDYKAYDSVLKLETRIEAGYMAHARRKFDELIKENQNPVAAQAVQRIAWPYRIEREAKALPAQARLAIRQAKAKPLCEELHIWLRLERQRVLDASVTANAIDYSLNRRTALTAYLVDGNVPIDDNHVENLMGHGPWAATPDCSSAANSPASTPLLS